MQFTLSRFLAACPMAMYEDETTEWEDVLVKKGILRERDEVAARKAAAEDVEKRIYVGSKPDLPDDFDSAEARETALERDRDTYAAGVKSRVEEEDELDMLRRLRLEKMRAQTTFRTYGSVVDRPKRREFDELVKDASADGTIVVVELCREDLERSNKCTLTFKRVARRRVGCKFVRYVANECIENWPSKNIPALIVYCEGNMLDKPIVGPREVGSDHPYSMEAAIEAVLGTGDPDAAAKRKKRWQRVNRDIVYEDEDVDLDERNRRLVRVDDDF